MPIAPLDKLHPRTAKFARYWERRRLDRKLTTAGTLASGSRRTDQPGWTDYYPDFPGTKIEKIVFKALVDLGITFYFGAYWGDMPFTEKEERYRPDFILPDYRIVIEVFGAYWHTMEGSYERDATRAALFEAAGYRFVILWDYDILANPYMILDTIPELVNPAVRGGKVIVGDRPFDPTASLVSQRRSQPKVVRLKVGRKVKFPNKMSSYRAYLAYPGTAKTIGTHPRFAGFPDEYLQQLREYTVSWKDYYARLEEYFKQFPTMSTYYPTYYDYWAKWYGWWDRWQRLTQEDWDTYFTALEGYFEQNPSQREDFMYQYHLWQRAGLRYAW